MEDKGGLRQSHDKVLRKEARSTQRPSLPPQTPANHGAATCLSFYGHTLPRFGRLSPPPRSARFGPSCRHRHSATSSISLYLASSDGGHSAHPAPARTDRP